MHVIILCGLLPCVWQAREILFVKQLLNSYMADATGQPLDKIEEGQCPFSLHLYLNP